MHDPGLRLVQAVHPRWSSQTFLVYTGALTVLGAAATWLRYQSFTAGRLLKDADVTSARLPAMLEKDFGALLPLVRWLNGALGLPRERK